MEVRYFNHSGFMVELEKNIFIFDYFKGSIPKLNENKQIYVFSSHKHHDHFNMEIFKKLEGYSNIKYILSNDIKLNEKYLERNGVNPKTKQDIVNISAERELCLGDICVKTLKSTDAGVAFIVECEGKTIYHAGDLNWWYWSGKDYNWNKRMECTYKKQIDTLADMCEIVDIAFVPVDVRQGGNAMLGIEYFCEKINAANIFPMHFWDDYSIFERINHNELLQKYQNRIIGIREDGQVWTMQHNM